MFRFVFHVRDLSQRAVLDHGGDTRTVDARPVGGSWQGWNSLRVRRVGSRLQASLPPERLHDLEDNEQDGAGTNRHREIVHVQRSEAEESLRQRP